MAFIQRNIGVLVALSVAIFFVAVLYLIGQHFKLPYKSKLPTIQGVVLANPAKLPHAALNNLSNAHFKYDKFIGHWSFITYGYTHCPDVCPMLLLTLSEVEKQFNAQFAHQTLNIYFYTVDQQRDTAIQLKQYVQYFSPTFNALRASSLQEALKFEQALGIKVKIEQSGNNRYTVMHTQSLFLINPNAELQAVLFPPQRAGQYLAFDAQQILQDTIKVIEHYALMATR